PEGRLIYDAERRRLSYQEGSRKAARQADAADLFGPKLLAYVAGNPGHSTNQLLEGAGGDRTAAQAALKKLLADDTLRREKRQGRGGGYAYFAPKSNQAEPG